MNFLLKLIFIFIFGVLIVLLVFGPKKTAENVTTYLSPSSTPFNPFPYNRPTIPDKQSYLTYLVGDSNTESLGVNANELRLKLIAHYPTKEFVNYNYGFGSTNILTLPDRLNTETTYKGTKFPPILTQGFDLIIIESFAYNPLSEYPLEEGLKKHNEILDQSIGQIIKANPNAVIAFMTSLAPNSKTYAKGVYDLSAETRLKWVIERKAYIQNHIDYAKKNNIPLINVYEKSLDANGDGDLRYINKDDNIHPSKEGIALMTQTIADFIYETSIFPH